MKIGFAGSDNFSLKILSGLMEIIADSSLSLSLVLTISPKNKGRGKTLGETPVSSFSKKNNLFIKTISPSRNVVDSLEDTISKLKDLKELLDSGVINQEEFNKLKKKIIN